MGILLEDAAYKPITTDPTTYLEKTTRTKINAAPINEDVKKHLIPREKSSKIPKLYGLPKIHKPNVPLRPIVSSTNSPTQSLARHLAAQLKPYGDQTASYVKNADHFLEIIKRHTLEPSDIIVSFDVTSLFTQVPVQETIAIIKKKYKPPTYLMDLVEHCLTNTYFTFNGQKYKQIEGAPMGSPLSPIIANLFMEEFETTALHSSPYKPKLWLRYVDDTFVIWTHGKQRLHEFHTHLNNIHPKIKFTMEIEENGRLPFLDVLVLKNDDGHFGHTIHRKATHTNRYLNAHSHHHPAQLQAVVKTLVTRSQRLTDSDNVKTEYNNITKILLSNGFSLNNIQKAFHTRTKQQKEQDNTRPKAYLPYIKHTTDKIKRTLQKYTIDTIFTTDRKIGEFLGNPKDRIPLEEQGVYEIPCGDCGLSYIGQTNRRISTRREEHRNGVRTRQLTSSLAQHTIMTGHKIDFDGTRMIVGTQHLPTRITREAIEIEKRPENLNKRNDAQRLPPAWRPTLANLEKTNKIAINSIGHAPTPRRALIGLPDQEKHATEAYKSTVRDNQLHSPVSSRTRGSRKR